MEHVANPGSLFTALFDKDDHTISSMWQLTGCQHSLQPTDNDYAPPSIPALTSRGFSRWESLEILLGPEEHVPFLQYAVKNWNLKNLETGEVFPSDLPKNVFPAQPDPDVDRWHEDCAANLWKEASSEDLPKVTKSEPTPETSSGPKFAYPKNADGHPYPRGQRPVSFTHVHGPPRPSAAAHHSTGRMPSRTPEIPRRESPPSRERERRRSFSDYPSSTTQENFPSHSYPPPAPSADANLRRPSTQARRNSHPRPLGSDSSDDEEQPNRRPQNSPQVPHNRRYPPSVQPSPNPGRSPRPSEPRMEELKRRAGSSPRLGIRERVSEKVAHIFPGAPIGTGRGAERRPQPDSRPGSYDSARARRSPHQRAPPSRLQREFPDSESAGSPGSDSEDEVGRRARAREDRERERERERERDRYSDKSRPYVLDNELDDDVGHGGRRQRQQNLRRPEAHRRTSSHADIDRRRESQGWDPRERDRSRAREERARWDRRPYDDRNNSSPVMGAPGRHYERAY